LSNAQSNFLLNTFFLTAGQSIVAGVTCSDGSVAAPGQCPTSSGTSSSGDGLSSGAIAGIIIGVVLGICLLILLLFLVFRVLSLGKPQSSNSVKSNEVSVVQHAGAYKQERSTFDNEPSASAQTRAVEMAEVKHDATEVAHDDDDTTEEGTAI